MTIHTHADGYSAFKGNAPGGKPRRKLPEYARRADKNQPAIVRAFRQLGCSVEHLHRVGCGVPDILVACAGHTIPVEIKNGDLPPSARELTPYQQKWHDKWRAPVFIVKDVNEVLKLVQIVRDYAEKCGRIA